MIIDLILLYSRYEIRWILDFMFALIIGIALLLNFFTGGIVHKYKDKVNTDKTYFVLRGIQWTVSLFLAIILPNNYLKDYHFFRKLFNLNEYWIPITMGVILFTSLLVFGLIYNLILKNKVGDVAENGHK